jgi:hypothetical protein
MYIRYLLAIVIFSARAEEDKVRTTNYEGGTPSKQDSYYVTVHGAPGLKTCGWDPALFKRKSAPLNIQAQDFFLSLSRGTPLPLLSFI